MNTITTTWRLVYSEPAAGAWNMAVDEAILEFSGKGLVPPTLRLYAWEPACLSLGLAQPYADVNQSELEHLGWHVVRRPTGGRAILHTDELTYSICGPPANPILAGGVLDSYRTISAALLECLRSLGIAAESHEIAAATGDHARQLAPVRKKEEDPVCFSEPSNYEITASGRKLIGSAQARRSEAVLQHGTLPLTGDLSRIVRVLSYPDEAARQASAVRLTSRATTVELVLGKTVSWDQAASAMSRAFESVLNLELVAENLTAQELARAAELQSIKYGSLKWTARI